jgi:MinD-like ATPase involved in chromosome partitioning or flagellar assembly
MAAATPAEIEAHLRRASTDVDVVVVDLPPALTDSAHQAVLGFPASLLVLAVELEPGSLQPAAKLVRMAQNARVEYEVVANKLNARTVTAGALMTLQGAYGDRVSNVMVRDDAKAPESIAKRQPLTAYKPKAASSKAIFEYAADLVERGIV